MLKSISAMQLDFRTIKEFTSLRHLLLFAGILLLFSFLSSPIAAIGMFMVYGMFYASYPFAVGEKTSIDILYASLPLPRKNLVVGRYLFALSTNLLTGLVSLVSALAISVITRKPMDLMEGALIVCVCFFLYSIIEFIQLPLYFKLGYTKARLLTYLPLFLIAGLVAAGRSLAKNAAFLAGFERVSLWFSQDSFLAICLVLAVWLVLLASSISLSCRLYSKREF